MSKEYHHVIAELWKGSRPNGGLSSYLGLTHGKPAHSGNLPGTGHVPHDSCELSVVDKDGNWVQMMETGGGGIPGVVVDGIMEAESVGNGTLWWSLRQDTARHRKHHRQA